MKSNLHFEKSRNHKITEWRKRLKIKKIGNLKQKSNKFVMNFLVNVEKATIFINIREYLNKFN